ncbi:MAG: ATP synthase F0 subunit C [Desulfobacterales bacterium]
MSPTWAAILGAGLASGLGAIGSGIGEGLVAKSGCEGIARQPLGATRVTNVMLLGMAVTETTAIYGLLIACILIFKSFPAAGIHCRIHGSPGCRAMYGYRRHRPRDRRRLCRAECRKMDRPQ